MTKIIAITGGKGGTGKSTVSTTLAIELSKKNKVLLVDADVDCPNDHLILDLKLKFVSKVKQRISKINESKCIHCQKCAKVCKPKALISRKENTPIFLPNLCNGCSACKLICPNNAITWDNKIIGKINTAQKDNLTLISGELKSGEAVSEFIVDKLNEWVGRMKTEFDYIIIDTAAGTHCPVISAIKQADDVFVVTEPTPLGIHDLEIILEVLSKIKKQNKIILNRSDLGKDNSNKLKIKKIASKFNSELVFEIPFSKMIMDSYSNSKIIQIENISSVISK
jgi:MinD superfamily P-loop ATPase